MGILATPPLSATVPKGSLWPGTEVWIPALWDTSSTPHSSVPLTPDPRAEPAAVTTPSPQTTLLGPPSILPDLRSRTLEITGVGRVLRITANMPSPTRPPPAPPAPSRLDDTLGSLGPPGRDREAAWHHETSRAGGQPGAGGSKVTSSWHDLLRPGLPCCGRP